MKQDLITCNQCNVHKGIHNFYIIIKEKLIDNSYQSYVICKDCIKKEYLEEYQKTDNDFRQALIIMCTKYNIYYDENLMKSTKDNNIEDGWNLFQQYIKYISSLRQYSGLKYKDSVWVTKDINKLEIGTTIEWSDIDFIDDDIKQLKVKIYNALQKEDFNAHNKWMNSLRDALELRDNLENKTKSIVTNKLVIENGSFELNSEKLMKYVEKALKERKYI